MNLEIDPKWIAGETKTSTLYNFEQGSDEWVSARCIGGSTICEIMGMSLYNTPAQSLMNVRCPRKLTMNSAIFRGSLGEDVVRKYIADKMGLNVRSVGMAVHNKYPWMRASPDGLYDLPNGELGIVEIKVFSSPSRCQMASTVTIPICSGKGPVGDSIFAEHFHQVHYTAGVIGAKEIVYVTLLCSPGGIVDTDDRLIVRRFPANVDVFENVHIPMAKVAYSKLLKYIEYERDFGITNFARMSR